VLEHAHARFVYREPGQRFRRARRGVRDRRDDLVDMELARRAKSAVRLVGSRDKVARLLNASQVGVHGGDRLTTQRSKSGEEFVASGARYVPSFDRKRG
jgi:protein-disulfide isomerase-like protein with CxxC motif